MIRKFAIGIIGLIGLLLVVFEVTFLATMPKQCQRIQQAQNG